MPAGGGGLSRCRGHDRLADDRAQGAPVGCWVVHFERGTASAEHKCGACSARGAEPWWPDERAEIEARMPHAEGPHGAQLGYWEDVIEAAAIDALAAPPPSPLKQAERRARGRSSQ